MSQGISQGDYHDEVSSHADRLRRFALQDIERDTAYNEFETAVRELVSDVLHHHQWFARTYHGPADHGAIIEYAADRDVDVETHRVITTATDSDDPAVVVKRVAYAMFEADVITTALSRGRPDE